MKLVIVESPAKCTTIKKYLGEDYLVVASYGHIRDLSTSGKGGLGVDIEKDFKPSYIINKDKVKVVKDLQNQAKKCDEVILATDPDREGEAIAWHLANVLKLPIDTTKRMEFHEITRDSITNALNNLRTINLNLVQSQETRRILDRIIGFKLSSLLYKKIKSRSAGRVQSAVLKLVVDHDKEINAFIPEEYWNLNTSINLNNKEINLEFIGDKNGKIEIHNESEAKKLLDNISDTFIVKDVQKSIKTKESKEPLTTSSLQQEAFAKLKFKTKKTQFVAQQLYEGINVGDEHVGLITYMRTDSTRLSPVFLEHAKKYIIDTFGEEYLGKVKQSKKNENVQDAHEAIRPTSNHRTPDSIKPYLNNDQYNLYKLIYNHTLASLLKGKKEEVTVVTLENNGLLFKFELTKTLFKGYQILYKDNSDNNGIDFDLNSEIKVEDKLSVFNKNAEQKFTQAPAHYSEAKLVKLMEETGIGRPSTYATTIETLRERKYVNDNAGILISTDQGIKTSRVLEKYFPEIVDVKYTAKMEDKLDKVQEGNQSRIKILKDFYEPFLVLVEKGYENIYVDEAIETGELCPKCGKPLVYKDGKNGTFIGCSNYPTCKYVKKEEKKEAKTTGELCPKCGKPLVERTDKKGNIFVACSGFPKCKFVKNETKNTFNESDYVKKCPKCDGWLVKKKGKYGYFLGCTNYPECNYMEKIVRKKRK